MVSQTQAIEPTYNPPTAPPRKAKPFANARYFKGKISLGIAWTMEIVDKVTLMRIPPPMNIDIELALAEITAPTRAMRGGTGQIFSIEDVAEAANDWREHTLHQ